MMLKFIVQPAIAAQVEGAVPAAPALLPDFNTCYEGPLCEPKPKKKPRQAQTQKVIISMLTKHVRVKRWEYGYFGLHQRFHTDQSGLNLDNSMDRSYVPLGLDDMVQISGQSSGAKRFCSLQVTLHADPNAPQPKIGPEMS